MQAFEDQPAVLAGRVIPSVSAWAFGGAKVGETSDLYDDENGYYLARLDSLQPGGEAEVREREGRGPRPRRSPACRRQARARGTEGRGGGGRKHAGDGGRSRRARRSRRRPMFARSSMVPGLGQFTEPIGAAFALPVGAVSQPVKSDDGVYVLRVDKRVVADSAAWVAQKAGAEGDCASSSFASSGSRCSCRTSGRLPRSTIVARTFRLPRGARKPERDRCTETTKGGPIGPPFFRVAGRAAA